MAEGTSPEVRPDTYSSLFVFVYVFNLIVGIGALSLPQSFSDAGFILGTVLLVILAFMSYITCTYMVEAMASANAYTRHQSRRRQKIVEARTPGVIQTNGLDINDDDDDIKGRYIPSSPLLSSQQSKNSKLSDGVETTPLIQPVLSEDDDSSEDSSNEGSVSSFSKGKYILPADDFEITTKFEMGTMANMFYRPVGIILYYIVICLYLYGDLAIYAVAIPKSLVVVVCSRPNSSNADAVGKFTGSANCFGGLTQLQFYYIFLAGVAIFLCPWTFFNLTKSKYLQLTTTILRNIAFFLMITLAIVKLIDKGSKGHPSGANFGGFPALFGVSIYAFMCQHSLPGMITPMTSKKRVFPLILTDIFLVLTLYLLLAYTGSFLYAQGDINDLYTLNFFTTQFSIKLSSGKQLLSLLGYYLALFPVFSLSSNFPIISITLRENLKELTLILFKRCNGDRPFHWVINRFFFPILAVGPPLVIAFGTTNVQLLVSVTGAYFGVFVQYIIPATLAFAAKYIITKRMGLNYRNKHKTPFSHVGFLILVFIWTAASLVVIISEDVVKIVNHFNHKHNSQNVTYF